MATAQGIDMTTVSEIVYTQNGVVFKAPTRARRASGEITMEFVFKAGAVVDVDVLVKKLATAIEKNEVTFSVAIGGKTIEAKRFAAAAVDVDSDGDGAITAQGQAPSSTSGLSDVAIAMIIVSGLLLVVIIALLYIVHNKKNGTSRVTATRV